MTGKTLTPTEFPGGPFFGPPEALPGSAALVAEIPASIRSKQKLLRVLAHQLQFPAYFGYNWDALEECLRDLSWLPAGDVQIRHRDLPLPPGSPDRHTYLQILCAVTACWNELGSRAMLCQLPAEVETEVRTLLGG